MISRRGFVAGSVTLLAAPLAAEAQQARQTTPSEKILRVGALLTDRTQDGYLQALTNLGYVEGQNIAIERRYTEGMRERLPGLAGELVGMNPEVILTVTGYQAAAVLAATKTIPIVAVAGDLVAEGLVQSLARPGGNITGVQLLQPDTARKRVALLKEAIPGLSRVGLFFGPVGQWFYDSVSQETQAAAQTLGLKLQIVQARKPSDIEIGFATLRTSRVEALLITADAFTVAHQGRLGELAGRYRMPSMCDFRAFVDAGHSMSYGADIGELYRRAAVQVDKILKGAKPADLPIEQPTKFELAINLKTARALGLTIPPSLLLRADQVIE